MQRKELNSSLKASSSIRKPEQRAPSANAAGWKCNRPPSKACAGELLGSSWGQAGKPEKSASSQGLVLAGKRMTPRKLLPWIRKGSAGLFPEEPVSSRARPASRWDLSSQERTSSQAVITVAGNTLEGGCVGP